MSLSLQHPKSLQLLSWQVDQQTVCRTVECVCASKGSSLRAYILQFPGLVKAEEELACRVECLELKNCLGLSKYRCAWKSRGIMVHLVAAPRQMQMPGGLKILHSEASTTRLQWQR